MVFDGVACSHTCTWSFTDVGAVVGLTCVSGWACQGARSGCLSASLSGGCYIMQGTPCVVQLRDLFSGAVTRVGGMGTHRCAAIAQQGAGMHAMVFAL